MDTHYKGLIWTNHALTRMHEREVKQSDAYATWSNPDRSRYAKTKAAWVYHRYINGQKIEVVAKKNEMKEWVILSVWAKTHANVRDKTGKENIFIGLLRKIFKI